MTGLDPTCEMSRLPVICEKLRPTFSATGWTTPGLVATAWKVDT